LAPAGPPAWYIRFSQWRPPTGPYRPALAWPTSPPDIAPHSSGGKGSVATYEDGRVRKLADRLDRAGVAQDLAQQIMLGGDGIVKTAKPEKKAAWLKLAMERMDDLLDQQTRRDVREACACCLGGKRLEVSRSIARQHDTLEARIQAANEARFVFGHSVTMTDDRKALVEFQPEGQPSYRCVCLPKVEMPVSITYCYCCGGHARYHLQNALGRKLTCEVRSSALSSAGTQPCTFLFSFAE
jgi:hypothetical protein